MCTISERNFSSPLSPIDNAVSRALAQAGAKNFPKPAPPQLCHCFQHCSWGCGGMAFYRILTIFCTWLCLRKKNQGKEVFPESDIFLLKNHLLRLERYSLVLHTIISEAMGQNGPILNHLQHYFQIYNIFVTHLCTFSHGRFLGDRNQYS